MIKPPVNAATMALIETGVLPIIHWLPDFTPKTPGGEVAKITLRHFLAHTSGLTYGFLSPNNEPLTCQLNSLLVALTDSARDRFALMRSGR